ncbi:MAG: bifunctional phosphoribosylaminoimidazolecarboxamide formyltransferase/IMP cyclohydrolase [Calditrichia bacterium]
MDKTIRIKRALISCWNKAGVAEFAGRLVKQNIEIISSGGTAAHLEKAGIKITRVEDLTGFPEMLDGRVKTLHPAIHGAILSRRIPDHLEQLSAHNIKPIDLVVVNLYPFAEQLETSADNTEEMVEMIDIGGPAMIRAAAKNFESVVVLHQPGQYKEFLNIWQKNNYTVPLNISRRYAAAAFSYTSGYDQQIGNYLQEEEIQSLLPDYFRLELNKQQDLRYGENPHQQASLYQFPSEHSGLEQLWGKEMSFNNYVDVDAAYQLICEFEAPAVAVIKHTNPCGLASGEDLPEVFQRALAGDSLSAYGGIISANREIGHETAELIVRSFFECIIAPGYTSEALEMLRKKKNLRILKKEPGGSPAPLDFKFISDGVLVQQKDNILYDPDSLRTVTDRTPEEREMKDLKFAWRAVKHVKSNGIVLARDSQVIGVGAGQMSRVDAVKIAVRKAREAKHNLEGAVMASDAFFPFPDGVETAQRAGITSVIQPGGSVRDEEVIKAANELNMSMLFTGIRHFKH